MINSFHLPFQYSNLVPNVKSFLRIFKTPRCHSSKLFDRLAGTLDRTVYSTKFPCAHGGKLRNLFFETVCFLAHMALDVRRIELELFIKIFLRKLYARHGLKYSNHNRCVKFSLF